MRVIYSLAIYFYGLLIYLAALLNNKKASQWIKGRKRIFKHLEADIGEVKDILWFHCASLGEFEQGRPVIESIKKNYPEASILLTFFSPSGYEIRKDYAFASYVYYLPLDRPIYARKFINIVNPKAVFFIKYEFWFNYLHQLKKKHIPVFLISGLFREKQHFFKFYGQWFKKHLYIFQHFFLQNQHSKKILENHSINHATISGDTRFDRVMKISRSVKKIPNIETFKNDKKILIAGSTWPRDEDIIIEYIHKTTLNDLKFIIAPHNVEESHIKSIEQKLGKRSIRFTQLDHSNVSDKEVVIVDCIGYLSSLYQYGWIAYIGGGFGKSIHNILEPATFGLPIIFGPNYKKFMEANDLVKLKGAFPIQGCEEFTALLQSFYTNKEKHNSCSEISKRYIIKNSGATSKIIDYLEEAGLL